RRETRAQGERSEYRTRFRSLLTSMVWLCRDRVRRARRGSTARSLAAFETFTAIGPICGCAITPRVVGHPLFDLGLEVLRLLHERVKRCEHRREFFGCEFGHDGES